MSRKQSESDVSDPPKDPATQAYTDVVAQTIAQNVPASSYVPEHPLDLRIVRRRRPSRLDDLEPVERLQLAALMHPESIENALAPGFVVEDFAPDIEVATVVDETGTVRFRLYGWNFGFGCLMAAEELTCIAIGYQHDLEHWNLAQRPIFWAMDRALRRRDHGFEQPLNFCWAIDKCWNEIAASEPGSEGSEPYIRESFAQFLATR